MEFDEPFEVVVNGQAYLIMPLEDETFEVYHGARRLGNIHADIGIDTELTWSSGDLIPLDDVAAIGYAIEMKEL